ncbi:Histidine--tRNA ligase [Polystyrenella longa]|uniref:Histidine--tRNA ligase n=1 Tax=Polystyrenella longa TaxID=2528007 RepID=A0A518CUC7_9PLAN|nr:histidine--tRNA ligase [Polystyrenella longa]QDU82815.1 Histidine--tRNA ligase [Polystyrenella longa]
MSSKEKTKTTLIKPQVLKGFRDYLPAQMIAREGLMETAREVYRSFGFSPIDTPALERTEVLLGKSGDETEKQMFRFRDQGDRDVTMRFDLTIPFARFAALHLNEIGTPFKRYHLGTVWRGENPGKGRFREFMQCDFDTIGTDSVMSDIETLLVIHELMCRLGFDQFMIHMNNRQILNGWLDKHGLLDQATVVLRALDKILKIGREGVIAEMGAQAGIAVEQAEGILRLTELKGNANEMLTQLEAVLADHESGLAGVKRTRTIFETVIAAGVPEERLKLDLSIARGLDYYTGVIFETFLTERPDFGSVCSGGRYDNLAGMFTKQELPGVGASLGLDRLLAAMIEMDCLELRECPADVIVTIMDNDRLPEYYRLGQQLRAAGIRNEVYPEDKQFKKQMKYADRKGFRFAIIAGSDEFEQGIWQVKDLKAQAQQALSETELIAFLKSELAPAAT